MMKIVASTLLSACVALSAGAVAPPPHAEVARFARYVVHDSTWTAMATVAAREPIMDYPFANIFSMSDGPLESSSGVPYMYLMPLELSAIDLSHNERASLTMTMAQSDYCKENNYDEQDPRCAHLILTGTVVKIEEDTEEGQLAREALFSRHPAMEFWPEDHGWFFCKLDIENILLLNYFGGAINVPVDDYFAAQI